MCCTLLKKSCCGLTCLLGDYKEAILSESERVRTLKARGTIVKQQANIKFSLSNERGTRVLDNCDVSDEPDANEISKFRLDLMTLDGSQLPYVVGYWLRNNQYFVEKNKEKCMNLVRTFIEWREQVV